jgi:hypothetical protein
MEMFLAMLVGLGVPAAAVSIYVVSIPCRVLVARGRSPGWYIAVLLAILIGAIAVLILGGPDLFHPSRWDTGKVTLRELAPLWFAGASIAALVSGWYVVGHYRDKVEASRNEITAD